MEGPKPSVLPITPPGRVSVFFGRARRQGRWPWSGNAADRPRRSRVGASGVPCCGGGIHPEAQASGRNLACLLPQTRDTPCGRKTPYGVERQILEQRPRPVNAPREQKSRKSPLPPKPRRVGRFFPQDACHGLWRRGANRWHAGVTMPWRFGQERGKPSQRPCSLDGVTQACTAFRLWAERGPSFARAGSLSSTRLTARRAVGRPWSSGDTRHNHSLGVSPTCSSTSATMSSGLAPWAWPSKFSTSRCRSAAGAAARMSS